MHLASMTHMSHERNSTHARHAMVHRHRCGIARGSCNLDSRLGRPTDDTPSGQSARWGGWGRAPEIQGLEGGQAGERAGGGGARRVSRQGLRPLHVRGYKGEERALAQAGKIVAV